MSKSSNHSNGIVKGDPKNTERLLEILKPSLQEVIQEGMDKFIGSGTQLLLNLLMQAEAQELCGKRYGRSRTRSAVRWGAEKGTAIVDGVKRGVQRPRVRVLRSPDAGHGEIQLETYKAMNRRELLDGPLLATILAGVSARQYANIVSRGLEAKGVKRSAISRKAIAATKPMVDQFRKRRLDKHDYLVLLFDGIHVAKKQLIVCIGVDMNGRKHVLGLHPGATENEIVCRDLIRDMIERGLEPGKRYLFVIDGSKALVGAIRAAFGQDVQIQRCQEHKIRDVQAYVPVKMRNELRAKMQAAYNVPTEKEAWRRLSELRLQLYHVGVSAVNALTEGLYETLTVHRLGVTGSLRKSLRTTNIMESAFSSVRRYMGRVTSFADEEQLKLWVTRSILESERHFRTVPGNRQLTKLREKLNQFPSQTK